MKIGVVLNKIIAKIKREVLVLFYILKLYNKPKIFCISMQRTGTTSCGQFLGDHGYRVAGYGNHSVNWSHLWWKGDFNRIFRTTKFLTSQAFEDNPWWLPDFYRILNHRFKKAKFILFYRNSNKWFDSMLNHSDGKTLGNTHNHCKIYRRLDEFYEKLDTDPNFKPKEKGIDNLMSLVGKRTHYIKVYEEYNREAMEYFNKYASEKLFVCTLEDPMKWQKLGKFLNINIERGYNVHVNKSKVKAKNCKQKNDNIPNRLGKYYIK